MGFDATIVTALADELQKIAAVSSPSIVASPSPGIKTVGMSIKPAGVVSPGKITAKALGATNLKKTNYTKVQTKAPSIDVSLASEQKAITPPTVKSS